MNDPKTHMPGLVLCYSLKVRPGTENIRKKSRNQVFVGYLVLPRLLEILKLSIKLRYRKKKLVQSLWIKYYLFRFPL